MMICAIQSLGVKLTKALLFYYLHPLGRVSLALHSRRKDTGESGMGFLLPQCKGDIFAPGHILWLEQVRQFYKCKGVRKCGRLI